MTVYKSEVQGTYITIHDGAVLPEWSPCCSLTDDSPFSVDFSFFLFWLQFASFSFEPIQRLEVYEMSEVLEHHLDPRHLIGPNNSLKWNGVLTNENRVYFTLGFI